MEFIEVFGQRFIGLIDDQNLYTTYRVPYPEAPYPQDYIIDQQGIVRYWSDEYDPQEIMRVIDGLLATSIEEQAGETSGLSGFRVTVSPNPSRGALTIYMKGLAGYASIRIYDALGRCVHAREGYYVGMTDISLDLPAGCYIIDIECEGKRHTSGLTITK
ncbi:MAG: T9SS type A sorting domain-containing protein [candidate division WOR-3 bacterium]|nr:T9SS type A sorting domain-containing protein [candidate division WOR-3 bacterium]